MGFIQLPRVDQDDTDGRRFRVENGESPGEKEEVGNGTDLVIKIISTIYFFPQTMIYFLTVDEFSSFVINLTKLLICTVDRNVLNDNE